MCVLCACANVHLYVFMCMCLYLCVCVCSCVCASDCVRACACVPVCGVCVRVCVVKSWRPGLRSTCVCVWQRWTLSPREYSRTQKRENSHSRTHKIKPTAAARHLWLGGCVPHEISISIRWKSSTTIMGGGWGWSPNKIVRIENAGHFSDSEVYDV